MRILHTGDWHLGDRLGPQKIDRSEDLGRALAQIARYLDQHQVDVMLVAGDLFSNYCRSHDRISAAVAQIRDHFAPFLIRGGTIVAISGNHDDEALFETLGHALELVAPSHSDHGDGASPGGRPYFFARPRREPLRLAGRDGQIVQFVPMPYPKGQYIPGNTRFTSKDQVNRIKQEQFRRVLREASRRVDERMPAILISHIAIRGVPVIHERRLSDSEDVLFEPSDISGRWAYAAYGHIHAASTVNSAEHSRYCGSIERLDAGEAGDKKSVVLVDILPGEPCRPEVLPLEATPIRQIVITDPEVDLKRLADEMKDRDRALIRYTLRYRRDRHNVDEICSRIKQLFPRWYDREILEEGSELAAESGEFRQQSLDNIAGNVRTFLDERLKPDDPDREALFALAEAFMVELEAGR
jgi:exonuclease SbcD